jgi:aldose 1-epimerase
MKTVFGTLENGRPVHAYVIKNTSGMRAVIIELGAAVLSLSVPDRNGSFADVVLGYKDVNDYVHSTTYCGAIVGRYGNRIGKGKFSLDGKEYQVTINNGENHLHGGLLGFDKVLWSVDGKRAPTDSSLTLCYTSKDGEEGYPGTVLIKVTFMITVNNALRIDYEGTTTKTTILNPTHHSYFNLTGDPTKTILDHYLSINAEQFTPVDGGTPFDFRSSRKIGGRVGENNEQLAFGKGYDHNWVLNNFSGAVRKIAELYDTESGRLMEMYSDQPGLQFYSGNFLNGSVVGKNGIAYQHRTGLCLEAQCFPDSPNRPEWPSTTLRPGSVYHQTTIYEFSTKK